MRDCLILQDVLRVSLHMPLKKKCKLVLGPFLCIIRYYSLGLFLCFYESLATAVLFTSLFHTSFAVCVAAHRHLINICWVNELTFLKGHSCKRGSSLKVYNLENINYVEMVYVMGLKSIPEKKKISGCLSGWGRQGIMFSLVVIHFHLLKRKGLPKFFNLMFLKFSQQEVHWVRGYFESGDSCC